MEHAVRPLMVRFVQAEDQIARTVFRGLHAFENDVRLVAAKQAQIAAAVAGRHLDGIVQFIAKRDGQIHVVRLVLRLPHRECVGEMMDAFVRPVVGGQRRPQQRHVHAVAFDVDAVFAVIKDCRATLPAFDQRRPFLVADFEAVRIVGPRRMRRPRHMAELDLMKRLVRMDVHWEVHFQHLVVFTPIDRRPELKMRGARRQHDVLREQRIMDLTRHAKHAEDGALSHDFHLRLLLDFERRQLVHAVDVPRVIGAGHVFVHAQAVARSGHELLRGIAVPRARQFAQRVETEFDDAVVQFRLRRLHAFAAFAEIRLRLRQRRPSASGQIDFRIRLAVQYLYGNLLVVRVFRAFERQFDNCPAVERKRVEIRHFLFAW